MRFFLQHPFALIPIGISFVLIVLGALVSKHSRFFCGYPIRQGILFGIISVIAKILAIDPTGNGYFLHLRDAAIAVAGFFFSPVAALVAGGISAAFQCIYPYLHDIILFPYVSIIGVITVTLFVAAYSQWILDREHPSIIVAGISGLLVGIIRVIVPYFYRGVSVAKLLEVSYDAYDFLPFATGFTTMFVACFFNSVRQWKKNFLSSLTWILLFLAIAHCFIFYRTNNDAERQLDAGLKEATRNFRQNINSQLDFLLHNSALSVLDHIERGSYRLSQETMQQLAAYHDIDELNIFSFDGNNVVLYASSDPSVIEYNKTPRPAGPLLPYRELLTGKRDILIQKFRPSRETPSTIVKYVGIPMPDRDAILELGYSWERFQRRFPLFFFPMLENFDIGDTGFLLVTDETGKILIPVKGHPDAVGKSLREIGMRQDQQSIVPFEMGQAQLFGIWGKYTRYTSVGNISFYTFIPYAEYFQPATNTNITATMILLFFCLLFRLTLLHIKKAQDKVDAMRKRDLAIASTIQNSELRHDPLETKEFRVDAEMTPAKEVGGDFYDYYLLDDGRIVVTIADVSGKGVPAAIFMMRARSILKSSMFRCNSLVDAVAMTNERLNQKNGAYMFVTAWVGIFDAKSGMLEFVFAGHNPPLIKRRNGSVEWLKNAAKSKPLAAFANSDYAAQSIRLHPGDRLFLYTDGVTEAMNKKNMLFGEERLEKYLRSAGEDLIAAIDGAVDRFAQKTTQADDITMLVLTVKPNE